MDLEPDWNLFQMHAEFLLAAMVASPATFLRDLHPAPNLEKNELNELYQNSGVESPFTEVMESQNLVRNFACSCYHRQGIFILQFGISFML